VLDASLKPDPKRKGSYYRRIEDIQRALDRLAVDAFPLPARFMALYFACDKLAHGVVGIYEGAAAQAAYKKSLDLSKLKQAAHLIGLPIIDDELEDLFAGPRDSYVLTRNSANGGSARMLRNNLVHEFGPTNAGHVLSHAAFFMPKMAALLACTPLVLDYLKAHFSHIP
jgi:hypothetical protein